MTPLQIFEDQLCPSLLPSPFSKLTNIPSFLTWRASNPFIFITPLCSLSKLLKMQIPCSRYRPSKMVLSPPMSWIQSFHQRDAAPYQVCDPPNKKQEKQKTNPRSWSGKLLLFSGCEVYSIYSRFLYQAFHKCETALDPQLVKFTLVTFQNLMTNVWAVSSLWDLSFFKNRHF